MRFEGLHVASFVIGFILFSSVKYPSFFVKQPQMTLVLTERKPRTAVVLTGVLRCFPQSGESLIKRVLELNDWPDLYVLAIYDSSKQIDLISLRMLRMLPNVKVVLQMDMLSNYSIFTCTTAD